MKRAAFVVAMTLLASRAAAEDKVACRKAFEEAQSLRDEGKLTAAREQMVVCTSTCPAGFRKACEGWLADIDKRMSTIVVRAVDDAGQDLVAVALTIDGKKIGERLDGKSLTLDPGTHEIKVEAADRPPVTKEIVVVEGERNRPVVITIAAPKKPVEVVKEPLVRAPASSSMPVAAIVVTSVGVAALGGFAYFGLKADRDHRALVDGCSRTASCAQDDKDRVVRGWMLADVFLGAGVVLVGVGTYLFLSHDSKPPSAAVGVAPIPGGAHAAMSVAF